MKIKRRKFLQIAATLPAIGYFKSFQERSEDETKEVEKIIEIIRLKYGEKFTDEQMNMLKKEIESNLRRRERLLSFKLSNWDEPDFKFQV